MKYRHLQIQFIALTRHAVPLSAQDSCVLPARLSLGRERERDCSLSTFNFRAGVIFVRFSGEREVAREGNAERDSRTTGGVHLYSRPALV